MIGKVHGGGMEPVYIASTGNHTITPGGGSALKWKYSKSDLGVPENGVIKDVIFNQEGSDNVFTRVWVSFDVKDDSIKLRCYNDDAYPRMIKFRLSVLYIMKS